MSDNTKFICDICNKEYSNAPNLKAHMKRIHNLQEIICIHCTQEFSTRDKLLDHYRVKHRNERPFLCNLCKFSFSRKQTLGDHMMVIHNQCKDCAEIFPTQDELYNHYRGVHRKKPSFLRKYTRKYTPSDQKVECEYCNRVFYTKDRLLHHYKSEHKIERPFICNVCDLSFSSIDELNKHIDTIHYEISAIIHRDRAIHQSETSSSSSNAITSSSNIQLGTGSSSSNPITNILKQIQYLQYQNQQNNQNEMNQQNNHMGLVIGTRVSFPLRNYDSDIIEVKEGIIKTYGQGEYEIEMADGNIITIREDLVKPTI